MHVMIAGAGIGGLTTALCCLQHGFAVSLFERASQLTEVGAGIQIPPNAMQVFRALNLEQSIQAEAFNPNALETRIGKSGKTVFQVPLNTAVLERWGAPYLHLHRADLIKVLEQRLLSESPSSINLEAEVVAYQQGPDGVSVSLADGRMFEADVLIAADGIHSMVRNQMLGDDAPRFTGNVAWRTTLPVSELKSMAPPPTACVWMGPGGHCVTYLLRRGELANLVAVVEAQDWQTESWTEEGSLEQALKDFKGWHPILLAMLERSKTLYRWGLFDRDPLSTWVDNRVALLGDAAHPMLPFMAQGAAMAVEDAWQLAADLGHHRDSPKAGLSAYFHHRFARASELQARSRANAKVFHKQSTIAQLASYGPMWLAGKFAPGQILKRLDLVYAYDVTKQSRASVSASSSL